MPQAKMNTVALEFVPPTLEDGPGRIAEELEKAMEFATAFGMAERVGHLMIPGMIEEDADRPVPLKPRFEPVETWELARAATPGLRGICTQVTAFLDEATLRSRFSQLLEADVDGIVFVGVPRTMEDGEGEGVPPVEALSVFRHLVPHRGAILIPTREAEAGRFLFKCDQGANFALTQLLYSDQIVHLLSEFARRSQHRPEILLSFGFVPRVESRVGLIRWLVQDPGNPLVETEQAFVSRLAESALTIKRRELVDLYKRVVDGVGALGFPMSIHFETPYGFSEPAFATFAAMLDYWAP